MFIVIVVYGSTNVILRRNLWDSLVSLSCNINILWMVMGAFNSILNSQERVRGYKIRLNHFEDFLDCVTTRGLTEIRYMGNYLTWSNR